MKFKTFFFCLIAVEHNWTASQQNDGVPSKDSDQPGHPPGEDSDQPGHPPSLIRVFAVCMKKAWVLSYPYSDQPGLPPSLIRIFAVRMKKAWVLSYPLNAQQRLWSHWTDAQADLSLSWAHSHFVGSVMRWFNFLWQNIGKTGVTNTKARFLVTLKHWLTFKISAIFSLTVMQS